MHELVLKAQKLLELHDYGRAESLFQELLADNNRPLSSEEREACLVDLCRLYYAITRYEQCLLTFEILKESYPDAVRRLGAYYARAALMAAKDSLPRGQIVDTQKAYLKAVEICNEYLTVDDPLTAEVNDCYVNFSRQFATGSTATFGSSREIEELKKAHADYKRMQSTTRSAPSGADAPADVSSLRHRDSADQPGHPGFFSYFHAFLVSPGMLLFVSLSLLFAGTVLASQILSMRAIDSQLPLQVYAGLSGSRELAFQEDGIVALRSGDSIERMKFDDIDSKPLNIYRLVFGHHEHELWFKKRNGVLESSDGASLYALDSPEYKIFQKTWDYKEYAQDDYKKRKLYPRLFDKANPLTANLYYTSPATGTAVLAPIILTGNAADQTWGARALRGDPWPEQKTKLEPYSIFCLNVDNCRFFVRATDKNGQLLSNGEPGQYYVIELVDGRSVSRPPELKLSVDSTEPAAGPGTLYVTNNGELQTYVEVFRFLIPAAIWANLVLALLWSIWFLNEGRSRRRVFFAFSQIVLPVMFLAGWYLLASF